MKLEVGKSYRTRDGRKVTIDEQSLHPLYPFGSRDLHLSFTDEGRFIKNRDDHDMNLVAEWSEEPNKGRAYLAGPMRGHPRYNFDAFHAAAADLRSQGWEVLCPAEMDLAVGFNPDTDTPDKAFLDGAMRRDVEAIIERADAIVMLPGWEHSTGAQAEMWLARWKHIPVYQYPGMVLIGVRENPDNLAIMKSVANSPFTREPAEYPDGNPKDAIGRAKCPLHLLPPVAMRATAEVLRHGANKYGEFNWRKAGINATVYIAAAMRHLAAYQDGEDNDPDSGLPHIAHVIAGMAILLDAEACRMLTDDRHKRP